MIKRLLWTGVCMGGYYAKIHQLFNDTSNVVLMYHSVGEPGRYGNVSQRRLKEDFKFLKSNYNVVDLPKVLKKGGRKKVAITFDDGFDDFYLNAVPIIHEMDVEATVFIVTQYIGSGPMMSKAEVKEIIEEYGNITIGNHTKTHPYLSRIGNDNELKRQISGAKTDLEDMFGIDVDRFSYPSGDFNEKVKNIVEENHSIAVSTKPRIISDDKFNMKSEDAYAIPRIAAHNSKPRVRWEATKIGSLMRELSNECGFTFR